VYERTEGATGIRCRHYDRKFADQAERLQREVPQTAQQTVMTAILRGTAGREASVEEALSSMYLPGYPVSEWEYLRSPGGTRVSVWDGQSS